MSRRRGGRVLTALLCVFPVTQTGLAMAQSVSPFDMSPEAAANPFEILPQDLTTYSGTDGAGSAAITRNDGQGVDFRDAASAESATIITNSGGIARFYDNSTGAAMRLTNNGSAGFTGNASAGSAAIVNNGDGGLYFEGNATAGDATVENSGYAAFRGNASAGNAVITNNQTGRISFSGAATAGQNLLANSGRVAFTENANAGSRFIANNLGGAVGFAGNSSAGSANIGNSGTLEFIDQASLSSGMIVNNQTGTVQFSGNATAAQGEIANAGQLQFSGSASAGSAIILTQTGGATYFSGNATGADAEMRLDDGAIVDISALANGGTSFGSLLGTGQVFLGGNRLTVGSNNLDTAVGGLSDGGVAGGTGGSLYKVGTGTLRLQGQNSYTGPTIVGSGTLQAANAGAFAPLSAVTVNAGALFDIAGFDQTIGSLAGDGTVELAANILTTGGDNSSTDFSGTFAGAGGIIKIGSGTFRISGVSAIFGPTRIAAGILQLDGALPLSPLTVDSGATLTGTGTAGSGLIAQGGTVAPGPGSETGIGTLSFAGDLTLQPGSYYAVDTDGLATDRLAVSGVAIIDGAALLLTQTGIYTPGASSVILSADSGVTGVFGTVSADYAFLDPVLIYTPTTVSLGLQRNSVSFAAVGETFNQRSTGAGLETTPADNLAQRAVLSGNAANARAAFDQLSGDAYSSLRAELIATSRLLESGMLRHMRLDDTPVEGDALPGAPGFWITGYGGARDRDSDGNAGAASASFGGAMGGVDIAAGQYGRFGLAALYGKGSMDVDTRASSADIESLMAGLYGSTNWRAFNFRLGATYGWHSIAMNRAVGFPYFSDFTTADYDASTASAFAEIGYEIAMGSMLLEPFGRISHVRVETDAVSENGGDARLTVESATDSVTYTNLGLRVAAPLGLAYALSGEAYVEASWQHAFGDTLPVSRLAFLGGLPFENRGLPLAEDSATVEAGVSLAVAPGLNFGLSYLGSFAADDTQHSGMVDISYRF